MSPERHGNARVEPGHLLRAHLQILLFALRVRLLFGQRRVAFGQLLLAVGHDTVGDVQVVPDGASLPDERAALDVTSWSDVRFAALYTELTGARLDPAVKASTDADVETTIAAAIDFAERSPFPDPEELCTDVYA